MSVAIKCFILFVATVQFSQLCLHMAPVSGSVCDLVSSYCTDPVTLLAPVSRNYRPHGIQLLHCVQIVIQPMGPETTRMTANNSPLIIETYISGFLKSAAVSEYYYNSIF